MDPQNSSLNLSGLRSRTTKNSICYKEVDSDQEESPNDSSSTLSGLECEFSDQGNESDAKADSEKEENPESSNLLDSDCSEAEESDAESENLDCDIFKKAMEDSIKRRAIIMSRMMSSLISKYVPEVTSHSTLSDPYWEPPPQISPNKYLNLETYVRKNVVEIIEKDNTQNQETAVLKSCFVQLIKLGPEEINKETNKCPTQSETVFTKSEFTEKDSGFEESNCSSLGETCSNEGKSKAGPETEGVALSQMEILISKSEAPHTLLPNVSFSKESPAIGDEKSHLGPEEINKQTNKCPTQSETVFTKSEFTEKDSGFEESNCSSLGETCSNEGKSKAGPETEGVALSQMEILISKSEAPHTLLLNLSFSKESPAIGDEKSHLEEALPSSMCVNGCPTEVVGKIFKDSTNSSPNKDCSAEEEIILQTPGVGTMDELVEREVTDKGLANCNEEIQSTLLQTSYSKTEVTEVILESKGKISSPSELNSKLSPEKSKILAAFSSKSKKALPPPAPAETVDCFSSSDDDTCTRSNPDPLMWLNNDGLSKSSSRKRSRLCLPAELTLPRKKPKPCDSFGRKKEGQACDDPHKADGKIREAVLKQTVVRKPITNPSAEKRVTIESTNEDADDGKSSYLPENKLDSAPNIIPLARQKSAESEKENSRKKKITFKFRPLFSLEEMFGGDVTEQPEDVPTVSKIERRSSTPFGRGKKWGRNRKVLTTQSLLENYKDNPSLLSVAAVYCPKELQIFEARTQANACSSSTERQSL